jgi:hypothetical protein
MPVTSYSRTPASNNSAPPNGAPEGWTPGSMNNTVRQIMTDIVNEGAKNQTKVLSSVAGTNTITASLSPALDAYSAGMMVVLTPANTSTGAATLNIDSLGALDILKPTGGALAAGELITGIPHLLMLDAGADDFILLGAVSVGSFTGTLTGYAVNPTGTVSYRIIGNLCTLYVATAITGTSNATSLTMTGLPAAVRPTIHRAVPCYLTDNSDNDVLGSALVQDDGSILFYRNVVSASVVRRSQTFTNTATKGIQDDWTVSYPLS